MHKLYFESYIMAVGPLTGAKRVKNVAIWEANSTKMGNCESNIAFEAL